MPLVSQNELGGLTEKAWRGLSITHPVPWGLAKDSNNMVQWLASRQLSFADSLIECLAMVKANPDLAQDNPLESGVLLAPLYGLVMIDSILAEDMAWDGQIYGVNFVIAGMGLLGSDQMADHHDSSHVPDPIIYRKSYGRMFRSDDTDEYFPPYRWQICIAWIRSYGVRSERRCHGFSVATGRA